MERCRAAGRVRTNSLEVRSPDFRSGRMLRSATRCIETRADGGPVRRLGELDCAEEIGQTHQENPRARKEACSEVWLSAIRDRQQGILQARSPHALEVGAISTYGSIRPLCSGLGGKRRAKALRYPQERFRKRIIGHVRS